MLFFKLGPSSLLPPSNLPCQFQGKIQGDFVVLSGCDFLQSSDRHPISPILEHSTAHAHVMLKIIYWTGVKYNHRHTLNSKALQEVRTPIPQPYICILISLIGKEGCLSQDIF